MPALIISDDEWTAQRVRQVLAEHRYESPPSHAVSAELAGSFLDRGDIELIVVVLSPDPERLLGLVIQSRAHIRGPILAVGPVNDARLVLRTLRGGASEYLDDNDLDGEMAEALRRCRQEQAPRRQGQLLAVFGPCGGTGASSVAANLAVALAQKSGRSLLVDLKPASGDLAAMLDLKPAHTLADVCQHAGQLDHTLFQRSLAAHARGVQLLASPHSLADLPYLTPDAVHKTLDLACNVFAQVLVDMDGNFRDIGEQALKMADVILLLLRLDFTGLRHAHRALNYFSELGIARERARVIVNRKGQPREISLAKAEQALAMKIFHAVPDDPKVMIQANNNGEPALIGAPSAGVSRSFVKLAQALTAASVTK